MSGMLVRGETLRDSTGCVRTTMSLWRKNFLLMSISCEGISHLDACIKSHISLRIIGWCSCREKYSEAAIVKDQILLLRSELKDVEREEQARNRCIAELLSTI